MKTHPLYIDELGEYVEVPVKAFEKNHFGGQVRVCGGDPRTGEVLGSIAVHDLESYSYIVVVQIGDAIIGFHPMSLLSVLESSPSAKPVQMYVDFDVLEKEAV